MSIRIAGRVAAALFVLAATTAAPAQDKTDSKVYENGKVANFSVATYDHSSPVFESFSFWNSPIGGNAIDYAYGKGDEAGHAAHAWTLMPMANISPWSSPIGLLLHLVPHGNVLLVSDRAGKYHKTFEWQSKARSTASGTFWQPCVAETEAMPFVRVRFLKK